MVDTINKAEELVEYWEYEISEAHPYVNMELQVEGPNEVLIDWIKAEPSGGGYGTNALSHLISLANEYEVTLVLHPDPNNYSKLKEYYIDLGFEETEGQSTLLKKEPE